MLLLHSVADEKEGIAMNRRLVRLWAVDRPRPIGRTGEERPFPVNHVVTVSPPTPVYKMLARRPPARTAALSCDENVFLDASSHLYMTSEL